MFDDREDAGKRLGRELQVYKDHDVLVLAIPRGGVEVGYEVARQLQADFSLVVVRKLPFPDNPEAGFGAIAEDGSTYLSKRASIWLPNNRISKIMAEQQNEIMRRIAILRAGRPLPEIEDRIVILVDDGIAAGSTMRAAIRLCKNRDAKRIIVAVPVGGIQVVREIEALVDEVVVLEIPPNFRAVAQVYRNWYDVYDPEVLRIMDAWKLDRSVMK
jgi:putative phosphoribosyl transferase